MKLNKRFLYLFLLSIMSAIAYSGKLSKPYAFMDQGLRFTQNKGQLSNDFLFTGDVGGTKIYFQKGKLSYVMTQVVSPESEVSRLDTQDSILKIHRVDLEFENSNPNAI